MGYIETFDDFESSDNVINETEQKPFGLRDEKDEKGTLAWLSSNYWEAEQKAMSRLWNFRRWRDLYKGIHWRSTNTRDYDRYVDYNQKKPQMVNNFIYEFVSNKVSQMAKYGTNFTAIPWNAGEQSDINNAKACDKLLKARSMELNMDDIHSQADKIKYIYGTVFQYTFWDSSVGPLHPAIQKLSDLYNGEIPKRIMKQMKTDKLHIGDVVTKNLTPDKVFPQNDVFEWDKVNHIDIIEWVDIHELKHQYPKKADDIIENRQNYFDFTMTDFTSPRSRILVRHFYHKKTDILPDGAYIKYCDGCILEQSGNKEKDGGLPITIDRDIIIEESLWGRPSIGQIEQMQRHYNNLDSTIARDLGMGSAPKWMVPKGSVDFRSLNNEFVIAEYKGPVAPRLEAHNPISSNIITVQDRMEGRMAKLMKVYDISRGEVPSGVTANSALRFLDEQESQANAEDVKKRRYRVISVYRKQISLMAQYYTETDDRTVRILGEKNDYQIKSLKKANFSKIYDIQLQNTSALPDTKTGKISAIVDLNMATQTDPIFKKEQVVQMLDMGLDEAFIDGATVSLNAANTIFEAMIEGEEEVPAPAEHDDLFLYYEVFYKKIQDIGFKMRVDEQTKERVYEYIKTVEGLLWIKSQSNMRLNQELMQLRYFPSFFKAPQPMPAIPMGGEEAGGAEAGGAVDTSQMKNAQTNLESEQKQPV